MVKKITMMQQRSSKHHSTVDSRRRLTNFKNVSSSMSVIACIGGAVGSVAVRAAWLR